MRSEGFEFDQPFVKRSRLPHPRFVHHYSLSIILTDGGGGGGGGRGVLPIRAYKGSPARKGYLFQALVMWKGSWSIRKVGKSVKGLQNDFIAVKNREKHLVLWSIHIFKIYKKVHLQLLKRMQSSKLGMWTIYHLSKKVYESNTQLFCRKWYMRR